MKNALMPQSAVPLVNGFVYLVLFALFAWLIAAKPYPVSGTDFWMHAGSVEVFAENLAAPQHTYDEYDAIRIRNFSPWQFLVASIKKTAGLSTLDAMVVGGILCIAVLFWAIWLFSTRLSDQALAPSALLLTLLFFIGTGFRWSEEIHGGILPVVSAYPSTIAVALALLAWYHTDKLLEQASLIRALVVGVCVSLVLLIHQLVFLHLGVVLFFWTLLSQAPWANRWYVLGGMLVGLALPLLWPYFNPYTVAYEAAIGGGGDGRWDNEFTEVSSLMDTPRSKFYAVDGVISALGPALLGLLLMPFVRARYRMALLVTTLFAFFMWFAGAHAGLPTSGYRWAMLATPLVQLPVAFFLALALSQLLLLPLKASRSMLLGLLMLVITVGAILSQARLMYWNYSETLSAHNPSLSHAAAWQSFLARVSGNIGENDKVIADHVESYTLTGQGVEPLLFSRKRHDINTGLIKLFDINTPLADKKSVLNALNGQWLLLDKQRHEPELEAHFNTLAERVDHDERFVFYRLSAG